MLLFSSCLLSLYLTSLLAFSFVTHPVSYCFLLLLGAFSVSGYVYLFLGFSWYLLLFCLVYIGGIYVLFVFVSLRSPNPIPLLGGGLEFLFSAFFFFFCLFVSAGFGSGSCYSDYSHYLCSYFEGFTYCLFCLVLMLGFVLSSVVGSEKDSFFR
uniref:NADH dehydrogenase subunit 6 n=1 Tax=Metorchis orientalis TaxID=674132 RepID=A0A0M4JSJ5_9TREM|nr:NADH dehydrogenase subunit 6 [Metorchis orientalis]ALD61617.1 NADH dehydrogenase subunit 6 [Metorchis orientalis]